MSIKEILDNLGVKIEGDFREYYSINAIWRGGADSKATLVNSRTGKWKDNVTGEKGNLNQLVAKILGRELTKEELRQYKELEEQLEDDLPPHFPQPPKIYPEECLNNLLPNYTYFERRGILRETLRLFENGMAQKGALYGRSVLPVRDIKKKLVGFAGRAIDEKRNPRWKFYGGKKSTWLYPIHLADQHIRESGKVLLVEGQSDVLYLWDRGIKNVLCTFGLHLSKSLLSYLISVSPKKIILSFNREESRRGEDAALEFNDKLTKYFDRDRVAAYFPDRKDWAISPQADIDNLRYFIDNCLNKEYKIRTQ